ncbi:MAG TPA: Na-translocating system protein MpsC family protein [Candidatus Omnitrophota bacterium]|nr:Na-translocating system protein MpsC family protein [Candidatus Omnitrophota bacterium]HQL40755.1 Na-translocating system protein MpsC family protein [Candidatus Omnitrophota bacterium]
MAVSSVSAIEELVNQKLHDLLEQFLGEDARSVTSKIVDDVIIVRFQNVLALGEKHLSEDPQGGRLIQDLKMKLIEKARPALERCIEDITGARVMDLHSSFNLATRERLEIFVLDQNLT